MCCKPRFGDGDPPGMFQGLCSPKCRGQAGKCTVSCEHSGPSLWAWSSEGTLDAPSFLALQLLASPSHVPRGPKTENNFDVPGAHLARSRGSAASN